MWIVPSNLPASAFVRVGVDSTEALSAVMYHYGTHIEMKKTKTGMKQVDGFFVIHPKFEFNEVADQLVRTEYKKVFGGAMKH